MIYYQSKDDVKEIVEIIPGKRMAMRIQKTTDRWGMNFYRVQYQYSVTDDIWRPYTFDDYREGSEGNRNNGWFQTIGKARSAARRHHRNNN
ncbi:hypothetical protein FDI40_gp131 [Agrobacterium phage Atu_ph07]|uniref:Uncharacterized protein n=1 Tax=Agrobacterium phage Atu_ph07 TaxID=2024264 RepID=A0A2L0UZG7_9CAUD|nr:hypothetical protein FDI40_gp131 [Agrobacterium phage Atu_ph07]AUZ94923.1 hypothetical protein [Agrobacterium phage Atu_ph07]